MTNKRKRGRPFRPDDGRTLKLYRIAVTPTEAALIKDWTTPDSRRRILMHYVEGKVAVEARKGT